MYRERESIYIYIYIWLGVWGGRVKVSGGRRGVRSGTGCQVEARRMIECGRHLVQAVGHCPLCQTEETKKGPRAAAELRTQSCTCACHAASRTT